MWRATRLTFGQAGEIVLKESGWVLGPFSWIDRINSGSKRSGILSSTETTKRTLSRIPVNFRTSIRMYRTMQGTEVQR
jgi:hypothetical protein